MCSHICALKHLRKAPECANDALDDLESSLSALRKAVRHTVRVIRIALHPSYPTIHATHSTAIHRSITSHPTHTTIHTGAISPHSTHTSHSRVRRGIC